MWLCVVLLGCKKVEPAPEALDDLFHYLWQNYDDGTDEQLVDALNNLVAAVEDGALDPPDGAVTSLSDEETALVGVTDRSADAASGVFIVHGFDCADAQLQEILSYGAQDELYEGVYEVYQRDFDGSREDWLGGGSDRLSYDIRYTAKPPIGSAYDAASEGALRRVVVPAGEAVVQRSYMPAPAEFEGDGKSYVDQDYQLEVYQPRGGGRILHVYAMWRDAEFSGLNMADESFQRIVINNMRDWDDNTAKLCEEGRP